MSIHSALPPSEAYSYWYLNSAYIARTKPDSRVIQHYNPASQAWEPENRIIFIKWLSEGRVKVPEDFANKIIAQWAANRARANNAPQ